VSTFTSELQLLHVPIRFAVFGLSVRLGAVANVLLAVVVVVVVLLLRRLLRSMRNQRFACVRLSSPRYSLIQLRGFQTGKNTAARNQYAPIREQRCGVSRAPGLHPTGNAERASGRVVDFRRGILVAAACD